MQGVGRPLGSTEAGWLARWSAGDDEAGRAFAQAVFPALWRFFANKVDEADAADLIQQTLLSCLSSAKRVSGARSFSAYLFSIARNALVRHLGTRGLVLDVDGRTELPAASVTSPSNVLARRAEHRTLLEALRSLPVDLQVAIELRYWEELDSSEIADVLGVPASTVRGRLQRAREQVQRRIDELAKEGPLGETGTNLEQWAAEVRAGFDEPDD